MAHVGAPEPSAGDVPHAGGQATTPGFARSVAATSIAHGALFVLSLLTSILVARMLGPEGKGAYAMVVLYASLFVFFSSIGLHQAAAFFLARKAFPPPEILGHTLFYLAVVTVAAVAAAVAMRPLLAAAVFPGVPVEWFVLGLPLIAGQHIFGFFAVLLLGLQDIAAYNLVQILRGAVLLVIGATVLWAGYGVIGILSAESASFLMIAGLAFILVFRRVRGISTSYNPGYVRASLKYGLAVYSGTALSFFHYRTALMLLSALASPAVVGLYSVAAGLAGNLTLISHGAATVLFPRISSETDAADSRELTPLVLRSVLLISAAAAAVLAWAGPWLITMIFTEAFTGSGRALQVLLPGAVSLCAWSILDSYFRGAGRPAWSTVTTGVAVATGAILGVWWIPRSGLLGAAAATSVAYFSSLLVALSAYTRLSGLPLRTILVPRRTDISLYRTALFHLVRLRDEGTPVQRGAAGERLL